MSNPNRVQSGVPTGGQFAPTTHAESEVELTAADAVAGSRTPITSDFVDLNDPGKVAKAVAYGIDPRLAAHTRGGNEMFDQVLHMATRRAKQGRWDEAQADIQAMADDFSTEHRTAQYARVANASAALAEMRAEADRTTPATGPATPGASA